MTKEIFHKPFMLVSIGIILHGIISIMTSSGQMDFATLKFFTILSNFLVVISFAVRLALFKKNSVLGQYLAVSALLAILVTGLVYNLVLVPFGGADMIFIGYGNFVTHFLAPVLVLFNYFYFEPKGQLNFRHILAGVVFPVVYWAVFVSIGGTIGFFPYFFMNPTQIGWPMVFVWFVMLVLCFVGLAALLVVYDKRKGKPPQMRNALVIILMLGVAGLFVSCNNGTPEAASAYTDISSEGLRFAPGVSLHIQLRDTRVVFQNHDYDDVHIQSFRSTHARFYQPVYKFTQTYDGLHLFVTEEPRVDSSRWGKNSSEPWGDIIISVPRHLAEYEIFYPLELDVRLIDIPTTIVSPDFTFIKEIDNPSMPMLLVRMEAWRQNEWRYGYNEYLVSITVFDYWDGTVQEITELRASYNKAFGNWVRIDADNPLNFHLADYNADGYMDMGLRKSPGGSMMDDPHYIWLWCTELGQFVRNAELEFMSYEGSIWQDADSWLGVGNIHSHASGGMGHDVWRSYSFINGELVHVQTWEEKFIYSEGEPHFRITITDHANDN